MKINIEKIKNNGYNFEDYVLKELDNPEFQKEYLNQALQEYINDGDFNLFFKSLERVIKSRESVSAFANKVSIDRTNLYSIFNGKKIPRMDTIAKILKELGYSLKVA